MPAPPLWAYSTPAVHRPALSRLLLCAVVAAACAGKGKGAPDFWVAVVRPGRVLYEIEGVTEELAREAFLRAHHKLPIKTRMIKRDGGL